MNILIAEDDQDIQELTSRLIKFWGHEYDLASNGEEAVNFAKKNEGKYDLCLMDISMPLMNGYEATRLIRQKLRYFPIMALTSNLDIEEKYIEVGMDDYLLKPYSVDSLYDKIKELTIKAIKVHRTKNKIILIKEIPVNADELNELKELKKKGLTKLKLVGTDYTFVVHKNIQNKISHDLIGEGKEMSEFIDRSQKEPGRCHLYKVNLHVTKDLFIPEELADAIMEEDKIAKKYKDPINKKNPD